MDKHKKEILPQQLEAMAQPEVSLKTSSNQNTETVNPLREQGYEFDGREELTLSGEPSTVKKHRKEKQGATNQREEPTSRKETVAYYIAKVKAIFATNQNSQSNFYEAKQNFAEIKSEFQQAVAQL